MKFFCTIALLFICCPGSFGQHYSLSNWTVEDGLSSNDITDILQDDEGFIWVATEHGLNTFDGYAFKKHRYQPGDSTSIGANFIKHICLDRRGDIWVNLAVGILSRYNRITKRFQSFDFPGQQSHILDMNFVEGTGLCVASSEGLFVFNEQSHTLQHWKTKPGIPEMIYKIFPHSDLGFYVSSDRGFLFYDVKTDQFSKTYFTEQKDTFSFEAYVISLSRDTNEGMSWIQTRYGAVCYSRDGIYFQKAISGPSQNNFKRKGGLFAIDRKRNKKYFLKHSNQLLVSSESSPDWQEFPLKKEGVRFSFTDRESTLWIFTDDNQLKKWDEHQWVSVLDLNGKLNHWEVSKVFIDQENGIWLGSKGKGLWRVFNRQWPISAVFAKNTKTQIDFPVSALFMTKSDYLWLGSFGKLYRYYPSSEEIIPWSAYSATNNPFEGANINDISQSPNGDFWVATSRGFTQLKEGGRTYRHFDQFTKNEEKIELDYIHSITADPSGRIWLGSHKGLIIYDPSKEQFYHFKTETSENSIRNNTVQCILPIARDTFLIGYVRDGVDLVFFDDVNKQIHCQKIHYKNSGIQHFDLMTANVFFPDDSKTYWLGTFSKGLLKINLKELTMRPISENFPIIPNIKEIQKDAEGNLWVSAIDGIRSIKPDDQTFYRFTKSSGLLSNQFYMNSATSDSAGNLYFGSSEGLNKIAPNQWNHQDTLAKPIISNFKKFDQSITFDTLLNQLKQIVLNHRDDFITFEFVSPTFDNAKDVQYAYQLDGFSDQWQYCNKQRSATFTNLPPGNYTFKVRAGNKGGFLNSEIKQIKLIVEPPFWQTGWFGLAIFAFLIFAWWLIYKIQQGIRLNRLKIATEIRQKAADDFHDELGHRLTKISLFVESLMLQKEKFPKATAITLRKIQDNANELFYSTRDFIWAMSPSKDSALDLFILLRDFGDQLFEDTEIHFSAQGFNERYKAHLLDMDWKRQLVLIFKEAMNNALKHADCKNVILKIEEYKNQMQIVLMDDGKGFDLNHEDFGYGLGSMINRAKRIGGKLEINTASDKGTEIIFKI